MLVGINMKICSRCIYDESIPNIDFDQDGVCNYCRMIDDLNETYGTGREKGLSIFKSIIKKIKLEGVKRKYDVIVGVSGGIDSSYLLKLAIDNGLRPLAVHYDDTWNTAIASQNIYKVTSALNVDLYTHVCDNKESDDIFKSFFLAGVPEVGGPTDIALAEVLYRAASKFKIKYVLEGHSFIEEGVSPMGKAYVDGGYISSVHRQHGKLPMATFPNMTFLRFLYWTVFKRIRKVRPFWYINYSKSKAKEELQSSFGWQDYGGHHLENRMSAFAHSIYGPKKFGVDHRNLVLAANVRAGKITRSHALQEYAKAPYVEDGLLNYVLKRFDIDRTTFDAQIKSPPKFYTSYKTYKKRFEHLRPLFFLLAKANLVPMSFYLKYCFPSKAPS
jgi:N-acetyl sugar amidotransferase